MKLFTQTLLAGSVFAMSQSAFANWSSTVTLASDYVFNGVSQTQNDPALQASLDYVASQGWYAGAWTSNVDYGETAEQELDFYAGHWLQLDDNWSMDYGIAYYTYIGSSEASELNYPEVWTKLAYSSNYGTTEFNGWYSWDYFGLGGGHVIGMIAHTFPITENHGIRVSVDTSNSLDDDSWVWDGDNGTSFVHYRVAYQTSWNKFNLEVAAEDTTLDIDTADKRIVASVSRTFSF